VSDQYQLYAGPACRRKPWGQKRNAPAGTIDHTRPVFSEPVLAIPRRVVENGHTMNRGNSHQVKVFDPAGKPLRAIGTAGPPKAGPYDPLHISNPNGLTIDSNGHLWVAETDFQPKRVTVWTLDGRLVRAFYGPAEYGGGGRLDPVDKSRFYFHGMEFQLDWQRGVDKLVTFMPAKCGGLTVMPDLSVVVSRVDSRAVRFLPQRPSTMPRRELC
jgi:hypothetical protein